MSLREIERACALHVLAEGRSDGVLDYLIATKVKYPARFAKLRRNDRETLVGCSEWLESLIVDKAVDRWPDNLIRGLVELHQIQAGTLTEDKAVMLKEHARHIVGRRRSTSRALSDAANLIDLPIGR